METYGVLGLLVIALLVRFVAWRVRRAIDARATAGERAPSPQSRALRRRRSDADDPMDPWFKDTAPADPASLPEWGHWPKPRVIRR